MTSPNNLKQFDKIYNLTYNHVLKYIICKCSNIEDVNDIIQETYMLIKLQMIQDGDTV